MHGCMHMSEPVAVQAAGKQSAGRTLDRLAPVSLVHADFYSAKDVYRRLRQRWEMPTDTLSTFMRADFAKKGLAATAEFERCMSCRVVGVNVWRSIDAEQPVRRCPLALCDPTSLTLPDEVVPFQICCPDVEFSEAHLLADGASAHRWYYYPQLRHDECLLFITGDTAGLLPAVPHTSFDDPRTSATDPPRRSIEARVFVIFDE